MAASRRYLFVEQPIGAFVVNFVLNAAIAWALFRGLNAIPMWGDPSIAGDTIATSLILPILSVWIATPLVRRDLHHGKVAREQGQLPGWAPRGTFLRSLVFGMLGLVVAGPLAVLVFHLSGVTQVAMPAFIWVKAAYAAALGAAFAPTIARTAIATANV
jgi:hypothetical protein